MGIRGRVERLEDRRRLRQVPREGRVQEEVWRECSRPELIERYERAVASAKAAREEYEAASPGAPWHLTEQLRDAQDERREALEELRAWSREV